MARKSKITADSVAEQARACIKVAMDADGGNRAAAVEDLQFSAGDQWPDEIKMQRMLDRRPCLTINKTDTFVRSVVNNMRQQRPRIKVHPVADGADQSIAEVIEGLIRHIEVSSNAEHAYDTAADFQVRMGWGFFRINARFADVKSFDKELYIDAVKNPFSVYFDPSSRSPDGLDAQWCVITDRMRRDEFKKLYPNAREEDFVSDGVGDDRALWSTKEEIGVAEFWRIDEEPDTLIQLSSGDVLYASEAKEWGFTEDPKVGMVVSMIRDGQKISAMVIDARDTMKRVVKWSKVTKTQELESKTWPGKYIPVVPVYGAELLDKGQLIRYGMVRQLKDPQRMYNFWRTQETEFVALAPKAPWLMAEGQDEGHEDEWASANVKNFSTLKYKVVEDAAGNTLPPPMRQQPQAIPAASVNAAMSASEDLKAVAGMFDPALGAPGQETSGKMVAERQAQSDLSNYHFYDNLTRSIRAAGLILLDLIPHTYNEFRTIRIIGEDGTPDAAQINKEAVDKVLNDLTVGRYDVVMDTGPGYDTKRQESALMMMEMLKSMPQLGQLAGDLIVGQMDWPGARTLAERLEMATPMAQVQKQIPQDLDPKAKQIIGQLMGQIQQMQQQMQQLSMEKAAKVFGVQQKEQAITQRELALSNEREIAETHRLHIREAGENHRASLASHTKIHDTNTRAAENRFEAVLEAHTDLALGRDQHDNDKT